MKAEGGKHAAWTRFFSWTKWTLWTGWTHAKSGERQGKSVHLVHLVHLVHSFLPPHKYGVNNQHTASRTRTGRDLESTSSRVTSLDLARTLSKWPASSPARPRS